MFLGIEFHSFWTSHLAIDHYDLHIYFEFNSVLETYSSNIEQTQAEKH